MIEKPLDAQPLFQHTAARRRLNRPLYLDGIPDLFQHTATRRRLSPAASAYRADICFNTQPPEGGWRRVGQAVQHRRGFNTQPPEGGCRPLYQPTDRLTRFNTQPPEGGWTGSPPAPRRWDVSTHSRPKAAGLTSSSTGFARCFNTQPPEGGTYLPFQAAW